MTARSEVEEAARKWLAANPWLATICSSHEPMLIESLASWASALIEDAVKAEREHDRPPETDSFGNYTDTRELWGALVDAMKKRAAAYADGDQHAIGLWETTALAHVAMLIEKSAIRRGQGRG